MVLVKMDVPVEGGAEAVDEAHRPEARVRAGVAAPAQMAIDDPQQDVQDGADGLRLSLEVPAQAFGHGEDPLTHRQRRDDVIDQVRRGLCHAPGVARRAQPSPASTEKATRKSCPQSGHLARAKP